MEFLKLRRTARSIFVIGSTILKNISGNLSIRNSLDTADAEITASRVNISGESIVLNSDAANTGADRTLTISRPTSGMTSALSLTFPANAGIVGQVLSSNGAGEMFWVSTGGGVENTLSFNSSTPFSLFPIPANNFISLIRVIILTPFNGSPSLSIGISGNTSKYLAGGVVDLSQPSLTGYNISPNIAANTVIENLIATYSAGGATVGSAKIIAYYSLLN